MPAIEVGKPAPDFTLPNQDNKPVTLSSLRGSPVVLNFYFADFSGICEGEMCEIRDSWSDYQRAGATVLGISRDSRFAHTAWKKQAGLKHDLLADMKGDVARLYETWNEEMGAAARLTVVIDKQGVIRYVQRSPIPEARSFTDALKAVTSAA